MTGTRRVRCIIIMNVSILRKIIVLLYILNEGRHTSNEYLTNDISAYRYILRIKCEIRLNFFTVNCKQTGYNSRSVEQRNYVENEHEREFIFTGKGNKGKRTRVFRVAALLFPHVETFRFSLDWQPSRHPRPNDDDKPSKSIEKSIFTPFHTSCHSRTHRIVGMMQTTQSAISYSSTKSDL